jgi:hypothetical protein
MKKLLLCIWFLVFTLAGGRALADTNAYTLTYDGPQFINSTAIPEVYPGIDAATVSHFGRDNSAPPGLDFEDVFFWDGVSPGNGYGDLVNVAKGPTGNPSTPLTPPAYGVISITPNYPNNYVRIISMDIASLDDNGTDETIDYIMVRNATASFLPYLSANVVIAGDVNNGTHTHIVFATNNPVAGGAPIEGPVNTTLQIWWEAQNGRVAVDNVQFEIVGPPPPSTKLLVTLPGQTRADGSLPAGTPTAQTAGVPFDLVLTAVNDSFMIDTTYNGIRTISYSGPGGNPTYGSANFANGQATVSATLKKAEMITITASGGGLTGVASSNVTVNAGAVARLQVLLPGETAAPGTTTGRSGTPTAQTAGSAILNGITVRTVDANWNPVSATPNVILTSSDANATIADDNGGGTVGNLTLVAGSGTLSSLTFKTAGARTVTATDAAAVLTADTSTSVTVNAGPFVKLQVLAPGENAAPGTGSGKSGTPDDQRVGNAFNVTVNAVDADWNLVNTVTGDTIQVTTSPATTPPPDNTLSGGTRTFSITPTTMGSLTVTADDLTNPAITDGVSSSITVIAATKLVIVLPGQSFSDGNPPTGVPSAQTAGTLFNLTLIAVNDSFVRDTGFSGLKTISYSGPGGSPEYTTAVSFTAGQATGVAMTLKKAETTTITAAAVAAGLTGVASSNLTVNAGTFTKLQVLAPGETAAAGTATGKTGMPGNQSVGNAFNVTVNAVDDFFNVISSATDLIDVTTSPVTPEPPDSALVGGTQIFAITPQAAGPLTVTATDVTNGTITQATSAVINVSVPSIARAYTLTYDGLGVANNAAIPDPYPGIDAAMVTHFGRDQSGAPFEDVFFRDGNIAPNRYGNLTNVAKGPAATPPSAPGWGVVSITPKYAGYSVRIISMDIASLDNDDVDETIDFIVVRDASGSFAPYVNVNPTIAGDVNNGTHTHIVFATNNPPGGGAPIEGPLNTTMQIWWDAQNQRVAVDNIQFEIVGPPLPPEGVVDYYTVVQGGTLAVPAPGVLANDVWGDNPGPLTAELVTAPEFGTLNLTNNGGFTFSSTSSAGMDGFLYRARNGAAQSGSTAALVSVLPPGTNFYDNFARPANVNVLTPWQVGRSNGTVLGTWSVANGLMLGGSGGGWATRM